MPAKVSVQGIDYHTVLEGPKSGPCILFAGTLMADIHDFDDNVPPLHDAGYQTLRFDYIGHGRTPPVANLASSLHLDDIVRQINFIMQARTGQPKVYAIIGNALGGILALRYATLFPGEITKLVVASLPALKATDGAKKMWATRIKQFEEQGNEEVVRASVQRWFPGDRREDDAVRAACEKGLRTCTFEGYKTVATAMSDFDYTDDYRKVKIPSLFVIGAEDISANPEFQRDIARELGAELVSIERAGHSPAMQKPEEFNRVVLQFLEKA